MNKYPTECPECGCCNLLVEITTDMEACLGTDGTLLILGQAKDSQFGLIDCQNCEYSFQPEDFKEIIPNLKQNH